MRTTIDIPDVLYKAVRTRTISEGTTLRHVTIALLGDWMDRPDWHPRLKPQYISKAEPAQRPRRQLACFGIVKPRTHTDGPHDIESIRGSIVAGFDEECVDPTEDAGAI